MTDLSSLSDDELRKLYQAETASQRGVAAPTTRLTVRPPGAVDLSKLSDAELQAQYEAEQAPGQDIIKSGGSGVASGALKLAGMLPDLSSGLHGVANKYLFDPVLNATIGPPKSTRTLSDLVTGAEGAQPPNINQLFGSENLQKNVEGVTGKFYQPQTPYGKYAHSVGEMLPGSLLAPGSIIARMISGVGAGLGSEAAGQAAENSQYEGAAPYARIAGALLGGLAPGIGGRAITPLPVSPARQNNLNVLRNEGVNSLTAGQRTGNKTLQYLESTASSQPFAGGGAERIQQEGQRQFTEAAMRRAGTGPDALPEVLANNQSRLSGQFQTLSARHTLNPDNQFITDITAAVTPYRNVVQSQQKAQVQGYIDDILPYVNGGAMPGEVYQKLRSRLSKQANNNRQNDPDLADALRGIRNALDNAMGRSIPAADQAAWQTARRQYGAQKTLENSASRAGEATAEGQITPANLRNTVSVKNRGAYARGEGDFSALARAGAGVMAPLPNSGTAQRLTAWNLLNQLTLGAVPAAAGRAIMSRPVQTYLGNQALTGAVRDNPTMQQGLIQALLEASRHKLIPVK